MRAIKLFFFGVILVSLAFVFVGRSFAKTESVILLSPSFQQLPMKAQFVVDVIIKADEPLVGADAKIKFDPRVLEVASIDPGDAFEKVPLKAVKGDTISLTAVDYRGNKFSGTGRLASLHFKAKDAGDTKIKISFSSGSTTDSNLTNPQVKDVLSKVDTGRFLIGSPLQRNVGAFKRFIFKVIPVLIFLILIAIIGYLAYRWWKSQKEAARPVFIPEHVPLDQPPLP